MDGCEARTQGAVIAALWPRPRTPNRAVQRAPAPRASFRRVLPAKQALHLVEDRGGDALLRRALDLALAGSRHERDCVVLRLEADSLTAHVVVDDEVDVLVREHRALAPEAGLAVVCAERDAHAARRAVADEADGVDRLACAAGADEHTPAGQRPGVAEQRLDPRRDVLRLRHPPDSPLALGHLALVGLDQLGAAREEGLD